MDPWFLEVKRLGHLCLKAWQDSLLSSIQISLSGQAQVAGWVDLLQQIYVWPPDAEIKCYQLHGLRYHAITIHFLSLFG